MTGQAVVLLCGLLFAHYLGDYTPLATPRMQEAKAVGGPLLFIAAHAAVHALLVALVVALVVGMAWPTLGEATAIVFSTHLVLDFGRAKLGQRYPKLNDCQKSGFWYSLGVDQLGHGLILVGVAALVV